MVYLFKNITFFGQPFAVYNFGPRGAQIMIFTAQISTNLAQNLCQIWKRSEQYFFSGSANLTFLADLWP
jgi:predicted permease